MHLMPLFVLFLPEPEQMHPDAPVSWFRLRSGRDAAVLESGTGPLRQTASQLRPRERWLAIVPGERVLLLRIALRAYSRAALLQALPYALEDQVSEELEALHIVAGPRVPDHRQWVAVTAHRDMETWLAGLQQAGWSRPQGMLPDTWLLTLPPAGKPSGRRLSSQPRSTPPFARTESPSPATAGQTATHLPQAPQAPREAATFPTFPTFPTFHTLQIYLDGQRCLVQAVDREPVALDLGLLPWWVQLERKRLGEHAADLSIGLYGAAEALLPEVLPAERFAGGAGGAGGAGVAGGAPTVWTYPGSVHLGWVTRLTAPPGLNLLEGRHAGSVTVSRHWQPWRLPAALLATLLLFLGATLALEVRQLERDVLRLDQAVTDWFEQTLPGTRMIDPVAQFRQYLGSTAPTDAPLASAIAERWARTATVLGTVATAEPSLSLRQVRADVSRLELELDIRSIAALETLRAQLATVSRGSVRILAAETDEQGVRARLQIEEFTR